MASSIACTGFPTAIGVCGIAWSNEGIAGVQLPEGDEAQTLARLRRRFPRAALAAPSAEASQAIAAIEELLSGKPADLHDIALDLRGVSAFNIRVYEVARAVDPGHTVTYGEVASQLGDSTLARAVGQARSQNPFPIIVPCHRVLAAGGMMGGFTANGGVDTKRRLLAIEGAAAVSQLVLFD